MIVSVIDGLEANVGACKNCFQVRIICNSAVDHAENCLCVFADLHVVRCGVVVDSHQAFACFDAPDEDFGVSRVCESRDSDWSASLLMASPALGKCANMLNAVRVSHFVAGLLELRTQKLGCYLAVVVRSDITSNSKYGA